MKKPRSTGGLGARSFEQGVGRNGDVQRTPGDGRNGPIRGIPGPRRSPTGNGNLSGGHKGASHRFHSVSNIRAGRGSKPREGFIWATNGMSVREGAYLAPDT